jgi:hypothetical protein
MIAIQVVVSGNLEEDMAKFGDHAPKLVDRVIRIVAYRFRKDLRKNYLSGQYLDKRSGDLQKSMVVGRRRGVKFVYLVGSKGIKDKKTGTVNVSSVKLANIYEHAGGYTIEPKNRKALVFTAADGSLVFTKRVHGREKPFMTASAKNFNWTTAFQKTEEEVIGKELKKLAKQGIYVPEDDL